MMSLKKKTRKIVSALLLLVMIATILPVNTAFAADSFKTTLTTNVENLLSTMNYSDSNCSIGNSIPTYVLENNEIKVAEVEYYPLLDGSNIGGLFGISHNGNSISALSFTTSYNQVLNNFINYNKNIAFLADSNNFIVISKTSSAVLVGNQINYNLSDVINFSSIETYSQIDLASTQISTNVNSVSSLYANGLSVPSKTQTSDYSCWAACVASIGQYKTNTNYSCSDVVEITGNYDYGDVNDIATSLANIYDISSYCYVQGTGAFYFNYLKSQIDADKPVAAVYATPSANYGHAVVLMGYNSSSSSASYAYMDPYDGNTYSASIYNDGYFTFVHGGYTYTLVDWVELM